MLGLSDQAVYDLQNAAMAVLILLLVVYASMVLEEHRSVSRMLETCR